MSAHPPGYLQYRARLGEGDLHPGGAPATARLLELLSARGTQRVLEVGAGVGNTSARMIARGWDVTALEPQPELFGILAARVGAAACRTAFLEHASTTAYDAIVAESVLFQLDLPRSFAHARALLRPGGCLALVDAVWRAGVSPDESRAWHERTQELFGIAVASRAPHTWADWVQQLQAAGFHTEHAERLRPGAAGHPPTRSWRRTLGAVARDPRLALWAAAYRLRKRRLHMPGGLLESWLYLGSLPANAD